MFEVPIIKNLTFKSDKEIILHFNTGITKVIDIAVFADSSNEEGLPDISLNAKGLLLNGKTISNCDLWSMGKFYGWDKKAQK